MNSNRVYELIELLATTTGRNDKIAILKRYDCEELRYVLKQAYDPAITFGITAMPTTEYVNGKGVLDGKVKTILDLLATRNLTGKTAKTTLEILTLRSAPKTVKLIDQILKKDLRCGISITTINQAFPNLIYQFKPMLAKQFDWQHVKFPCYIQPKIDGIRAILKGGKFYTRTGKELKGLRHLEVEHDYTFDGELYISEIPFEVLSGKVRNYKEEPDIVYYVFDIPSFERSRYDTRLNVAKEIIKSKVLPTKILQVSTYIAHRKEDLMLYYKMFIERGWEGIMIKSMQHTYQNKRSWDWMKMKKRETTDLICVDIKYGEGKYSNVLGYLICMYGDKEVRVGSGFTDEQRHDFSLYPPINKIIEVYFQELTITGVLRHPVFKCLKEGM